MALVQNPDGSWVYEGAGNIYEALSAEALRRTGGDMALADQIILDVKMRGTMQDFIEGRDKGVLFGTMPEPKYLNVAALGKDPTPFTGGSAAQAKRLRDLALGGGGTEEIMTGFGTADVAPGGVLPGARGDLWLDPQTGQPRRTPGDGLPDPTDVGGGWQNDLVELQALRDAANAQYNAGILRNQIRATENQRVAAAGQLELGQTSEASRAGLGALDLAMRNRGPENAIQYSNLMRGVENMEYPALLRRAGRMANAGRGSVNPFAGMVNMNQLGGNATGAPGILRAFDPNQASLQELSTWSDYDWEIYLNSLESAGGSRGPQLHALSQVAPQTSSVGGGRIF
jgi:hypothetical protein